MHRSLAFLCALLVLLRPSVNAEGWNYADEGPDVWRDQYPACSGHSQSPIDIDTSTTMYLPFTHFQFGSGYGMAHDFNMVNNGHTIVATYAGTGSPGIYFQGGGLVGTFDLHSFHLHWGENYRSGSEHEVNGEKYAAELHIVHYNSVTGKYAVLGMFIETVKDGSSTHTRRRKRDTTATANGTSNDWIRFLSESAKLNATNSTLRTSLTLGSLFTSDTENYWRYAGSLTTPPCTEGIIWTVFREPIVLPDSYFRSMRQQLFAKSARGPQPLYGRNVYRSYSKEESSAAVALVSFRSYFSVLSCVLIYLYTFF